MSPHRMPAGADEAPVESQPAPITAGEVCIVLLSWNRRAETLACLQSLSDAWFCGARAIVVDNGSRDGTVFAIRQEFPHVDVIALRENRGFAGGNNVGIRKALDGGARAVLLLNNDTEVAPDFLGWLLHTLNTQPRAGAVSAAILRFDHREILDVAYLEVFFGHGLVHRRGVNALPGAGFDRAKPVEVGIGTCLLIRREAFERVGLLDEAYFAYHEEVDWCFRARQAGLEVWYQPLARVWHHGSRSTAAASAIVPPSEPDPWRGELETRIPLTWNPVRTYLGARNSVRFVRAHGTLRQKLYFLCSTLYAVPLAFLAAVLDGEEELMLGHWTYRRALVVACVGRIGGTPMGRRLRALLRAPVVLGWRLPRLLARGHRTGRTGQIEEHVRGLVDGVRDRPLPLERLGLR